MVSTANFGKLRDKSRIRALLSSIRAPYYPIRPNNWKEYPFTLDSFSVFGVSFYSKILQIMNRTSPDIVSKDYSLAKLEGVVQHYAWGGTDFIPDLIHTSNPTKTPFAELWMGAHPKAPSNVEWEGSHLQLNTLISRDPKKILGEEVARTFDHRLPYLFKVLDVKKMLSIQVHPTKTEAEIGFERENSLGIPITAKHRNYRDNNHKPEIMVALTDFWLLHGFKPVSQIQKLIGQTAEFESLRTPISTGSLYMLYKHLMEMPQVEVNEILAPLVQRLKPGVESGKYQKNDAAYWAVKSVEDNSSVDGDYDRGIFSIFLFNLCHLEKGQGIFQDAGIPHAYLEGVNVELMANSDNVLRGGLTPKHIDVPELLKHTRFESVEPKVLSGIPVSRTEKKYKSPVRDFELSAIHIPKGSTHHQSQDHSLDILLLVEGEIHIKGNVKDLAISKGEICMIPADIRYTITGNTPATLYKATVPVS